MSWTSQSRLLVPEADASSQVISSRFVIPEDSLERLGFFHGSVHLLSMDVSFVGIVLSELPDWKTPGGTVEFILLTPSPVQHIFVAVFLSYIVSYFV